MGQSIHDVLLALGAKAVRDASSKENVLALDLELLEVRSVFGGALKGEAMVAVSSNEAFAFQRPKELAQCGTLWLPGVETVEAVSQAIVDAHDTLRARLEDDQQSLRKLGLKPKLVAPDPRARAVVEVDGQEARVAIDANGDLVLETIAGQRVPSEHGRVFAPEDVTEDEAMERLEEHIKKLTARGVLGGDADDEDSEPGVGRASPGDGFDVDIGGDVWDDDEVSATASVPVRPNETQATRGLSEEQLAELEAALSEDSEGLVDDDDDDVPEQNELIDASDEAEPLTAGDDDDNSVTAHGIEVDGIHPRFARDVDDEPKTISIQARKPSSLLAALDNEEQAEADELPSVDAGADPDDDDYDERTTSALGAGLTLSEKGRPPAAARAAVTVDPEASDDDVRDAVDAASDDHDPAIEGGHPQRASDDDDDGASAARDQLGPNPSSDDLDHTGSIDAELLATERAAAVERAAAAARAAAGEDVSIDDGEDAAVDDDEDVAVDDEDQDDAFRAGELRVDDFPALPADSQDSEPAPTTVSLEGALPMMTKNPTMPMPAPARTSDEDVEAVAAGFDDGEGEHIAAPRTATPRPGPVTMEEPSVNMPTKGTVSQPAEPPEDLVPSAAASDEDSVEASADDGAAGERSGEPLRESVGALNDESDDELEDALVARLGAPDAPPPNHVHIADDELEDPNTARTRAIFLPSDLDAMKQMEAAARATARGLGTLDIAVTGEIGVDDVDLLEARATALEEEARALRERALILRTRRSERPATLMSIDPSFSNATSLPILGSMEVQALSSVDDPTAAVEVSRRTSLQSVALAPPVAKDAQRAEAEASAAQRAEAEASAAQRAEASAAQRAEASAAQRAEASAAQRAEASAAQFEVDVDEALEPADGVSLAEVQAALGDVGALSGEATQVGSLRDGRVTDLKNGHSGDSDVFESAGPAPARKPVPTRVKQHDMLLSDRPTAPMPGARAAVADAEADARSIVDDDEADAFATSAVAPEPAEIVPAARPSNLGGIGLVVEDPRARDRLKKHLTPRFRRLVEAPDAMSAAALPEVSDVEALVFVRPRPDEATREGIVQLCDGPMPPRILIISSDARFDEMPEVSLRLPLGQRASEVAQQVLDGLRTLGVETLEADP